MAQLLDLVQLLDYSRGSNTEHSNSEPIWILNILKFGIGMVGFRYGWDHSSSFSYGLDHSKTELQKDSSW